MTTAAPANAADPTANSIIRHDALGALGGLGLAATLAWLPPAALAAGGVGVGLLAILAAPLLGLALAAFGVPFGSLAPLPLGAGALTFTPIALAIAALGWTLAALARRRLPSIPAASRPLLWPLGVMLICLAAATWRAPDLLAAVFDLARWVLLGLALVLAAALADRPRTSRLLLLAILAAGTAAALAGLFTAVRGSGPEAFAAAGGLYRAYGTFGQPNPFAGYMNMVWPIGVALALVAAVPLVSGRRVEDPGIPRLLAVAGLVAAGASGMALVLSWSRGGWLAAVVGAGVMGLVWLAAVLRDRRRRPRALLLLWFALVAAGLLLVAGAVRVPEGIADRLASIGETFAVWDVGDAEVNDANFATIERVAHWEAAAAMWSARPWLGQGPGHYPLAYAAFRAPRWSDPLGHAHNIYLNLLAETGLIGLAGYLLFFGAAFLCALRAALRPRAAIEAALGLGLAGVLGALAFHSLLDNLYVHDLTVQIGLLLGLTVAAGRTSAVGRAA